MVIAVWATKFEASSLHSVESPGACSACGRGPTALGQSRVGPSSCPTRAVGLSTSAPRPTRPSSLAPCLGLQPLPAAPPTRAATGRPRVLAGQDLAEVSACRKVSSALADPRPRAPGRQAPPAMSPAGWLGRSPCLTQKTLDGQTDEPKGSGTEVSGAAAARATGALPPERQL